MSSNEFTEAIMSQGENEVVISQDLLKWYESHKRDLPWRISKDPYIIWVSEIILQQTRVAQGLEYFLRFTRRFPNIGALASAEEDEVLKYWQGLGYYSRARNLHSAAKYIMETFDGVFPKTYKDILSLKGIGEYTAAAIASFVWNQPYPVVDGNVYRVLSRLFAIDTPIDSSKGKKLFTELADLLLDPTNAATHNQAIMELGALQCVPKNPDCAACPLSHRCIAFARQDVSSFPVKQNKAKSRDRYFHYLRIVDKNRTWLNRREEKDIWAGLYEFPLIETSQALDFNGLCETQPFRDLLGDAGRLDITPGPSNVRHILSHQVLYASFYTIAIEKVPDTLSKYISLPCDDIGKYAVPRLIHIYLEKLDGNLSE